MEEKEEEEKEKEEEEEERDAPEDLAGTHDVVGLGVTTGGTMSRRESRGQLRRTPSMQELLHDDFRTYFKETNTRTLQIQRQYSGDLSSPGKPKSTQGQRVGQKPKQHFVVCDRQGGYAVESQTAVSQLYLKMQQEGEEQSRAAMLRPATNHLLTPITVAPYLEYRQGKSPGSNFGAGSSPWDSPQPVRHRVHLADLVSAKNVPSDLFVKTGLLRPLNVANPHPEEEEENEEEKKKEDCQDGVGNEQQQPPLQQEVKQGVCGGESPEGLGREHMALEVSGSDSQLQYATGGVGAAMQQSTSMPTLQVLSSLSQLEFSVPPSQLVQRLVGPPLGQERVEGGVHEHDEEEGEEVTGGLIFRTMSPVGSRYRSHVDLGHFSHMRPSEHPQLSQHATLQSLNLADSLLTAPALGNVLESLSNKKNKHIFQHLRKLDLSGNKVGDEGMICLSDALSGGCPHLSDVSIRGNQVTDAGAVELLQAILEGGGGESLLKLDLGENLLNFAIPRLAELLTQLPLLRVLDLSWNTITLVTFAEKVSARSLIEKCRQLQVFSVAYNRMGDAGVALFLQAFESAPSMQLADLAYCFCTEKVLKPLLSLVRQPLSDEGGGGGAAAAGVALIMLHGVALPLAGTEEVISAGEESGRRVILEGHHTGISINLKY